MNGDQYVPEHFTANRFSLYGITYSSMGSAAPSKPISASKSLTVPSLTADLSRPLK